MRLGSGGEVESRIFFDFDCFDSGGGDGICLWFGRFWGNHNHCFFWFATVFGFCFFDLRGGVRFWKSTAYHPCYLPMVCHRRYFFRLPILRKHAILRKQQAIEVIEMSGLVFGRVFSRFQRGPEIGLIPEKRRARYTPMVCPGRRYLCLPVFATPPGDSSD